MVSLSDLVALINQGKENVAYMRWRLFRQVGKVSYCAYLIHCGVFWLVLHFGFHAVAGAGCEPISPRQ